MFDRGATAKLPAPERLRPHAPPDRGRVPLWADPRKEPPPGHRRFTTQTPLGGQAIGPGPGFSVAVAGTRLSAAVVGIVREVTYEVNNLLPSSLITFALRVNQAPVSGYTYRFSAYGSPHASVIYDVNTTFIELPSRGLLDVLITVADGGTYTAFVTLGGWDYPKDLLSYGTVKG